MIQKLQITFVTAVIFAALVITASPVYSQIGDNTQLSLAWHEASDFVFTRGYIITAGGTLRDQVDIDQDGKGELLSYEQDGGQHIVYLFEASSDNTLNIIWQFQFSDGTLGIAGNERGIMVTDIDHDGFQEIVVIVDSAHPDSTDGFKAGFIFEWDGTDNGIPSTPTARFDPPRDAAGRVALENNSLAMDIDNDGEVELILTHRGGNGKLLSIIQLTSTDLAANGVTMTVEFDENNTTLVTPADSVLFQAKNTGFGITDVDKDGLKEIIMWDDNSGFVRVYEGTGVNGYEFVKQWQPNPTGWASGATVKSQVPHADFDKNGVRELYLSDNKGNSWIVTPNGVVATMFDDGNWTKLHDWKVGNVHNEGGENRGNLIGDVDRDGKPDIYLAGNNFGSIMDIEYDGGDVTNGDNYSYFVTAIDANDEVDGGHFARPSNIQLVDMDGDGHLEILAIVPWSGANPVDNLLGLYLFEYNNTSPVAVGVDDGSLGSQLPKTLSLRQNYPNPFNPITNIMYDVPASASVSLRIYDMLGRSVITLVNEQQSAGSYNVEWNGKNSSGIQVTSGIYFYRLEAGQSATTKKMLLLR
ncbi:MAG: T9SS type A sorting domain-containing protein [Candidatus Marinimicrobia bacterium]|nr:T9SS type A sorting domain-containing protein [Candidatus Neomarinimicrobiota bacterium]